MIDYIIRPMNHADLHQILQIERDVFEDPWQEEMFYYELEMKKSYVMESNSSKDIVGYVCGVEVLDEYMISNIAIRKDKQGLGYGSILLENLLLRIIKSDCRFCFLEVRVSNIRAINLYGKLGFVMVGKRKNYYNKPQEDALVMRCNLKEFLATKSSPVNGIKSPKVTNFLEVYWNNDQNEKSRKVPR